MQWRYSFVQCVYQHFGVKSLFSSEQPKAGSKLAMGWQWIYRNPMNKLTPRTHATWPMFSAHCSLVCQLYLKSCLGMCRELIYIQIAYRIHLYFGYRRQEPSKLRIYSTLARTLKRIYSNIFIFYIQYYIWFNSWTFDYKLTESLHFNERTFNRSDVYTNPNANANYQTSLFKYNNNVCVKPVTIIHLSLVTFAPNCNVLWWKLQFTVANSLRFRWFRH